MRSARNSKEGWKPSPEQLALIPELSGNSINGLHESERRRPRYVYWHDPDLIAHGRLQQWYYGQNNTPAAIAARKRSYEVEARILPPVSDRIVERMPAEWTAAVKEIARSAGADQVGITQLRAEQVFEGCELNYAWIIVIAVRMDYGPLSRAPGVETSVEVMDKYALGSSAAFDVAAWIRRQGWDALHHGGPKAGPVMLIPHAVAAGIGQLGKHGSMINREFGSSFRLACVVTDLPLSPDAEDEFGSDDFCLSCQACTNACPPGAIGEAKQLVRGETKWYADFDKCILYFNENQSCAICLAVCPWSRPGVAPNLAAKMLRRRKKARAIDNAG